MFTRLSKYQLVADHVADLSGQLIDVGARDRALMPYIQPTGLEYLSSDIVPGHDYCWNIEAPLEVQDDSFEAVVALDVLEHVEEIHAALRELLRITKRRLYISLPNMTCLSFRIHFFRFGTLSNKYALLPHHQGDRHRWLTSYPQSCRFVQHIADEANCRVRQYNIVTGYDRWQYLAARLPLPASLKTYTMFFEITKPGP